MNDAMTKTYTMYQINNADSGKWEYATSCGMDANDKANELVTENPCNTYKITTYTV